MAVPPTATKIVETLDPQAIKDFRILCTLTLETGELISPSDWSIVPLPAALALGFEMIEGDAVYPDPLLAATNTAFDFWARVDPAFAGDEAFQGVGTPVPLEVTFYTDHVPPRKHQITVLITLAES